MTFALSIMPPWTLALLELGKDVENRSWVPPARIIGQRIALHASRTYDAEGEVHVRETMGLDFDGRKCARGAVVGAATLVGWTRKGGACSSPQVRTPIEQSRWFTGPIGWLLEERIALPRPIFCRGFQGLWELPHDVELTFGKLLLTAATPIA